MIFAPIIKILRSLKFTIFLMICLGVVFLIGLIVPQKGLLGKESYLRWKTEKPGLVSFLETLDFTDIYTSVLTLTLWALFFLNLILVMSNRIPSMWRRCQKTDMPTDIESLRSSKNYEVIEGADIKATGRVVSKMGYRFFVSNNSFLAVKNRFSPLATILFHLSFFLLLLGGAISFYTKFRANADIGAGETFTGQYSKITPPKIGNIPTATAFSIEEIKPTYYKKDLAIDLKVVLNTKKGRKTIGINKPYKEGAISFVISDLDMQPLFIIEDSEGKGIDGAYVKLKVLSGKEDSFQMAGYDFKTTFYTDITAIGAPYNQSGEKTNLPQALKQMPLPSTGQPKEVLNPAFKIAVFKDRTLLAEKTIIRGQHLEFDGNRLVFKDLTYWVGFYVVKEHGLGIVYTGFVLMTAALIIRFVFYRRDIKGIAEQETIHISGKSEYFQTLFADEFRKIIKETRPSGGKGL